MVIGNKHRMVCAAIGVFFSITMWNGKSWTQEPALPEGLGEKSSREASKGPSLPEGLTQKSPGPSEPSSSGPALPSGLGEEKTPSSQAPSPEPAIPSGLEQKARTEKETTKKEKGKGWTLPANLSGFWEVRGGVRVQDDPVEDRVSLAETRLQLSYDQYLADYLPRGQFHITSDFIFDATVDDHDDVDLEDGEGWIDLRELWLSLTPVDFMDVKAGRQILTWGTGNLIFLNDLFPKDYQSFFLGRDVEYLKAPSDAVKASLYSEVANVDIVYTPKFDPDRYIDGSRISFYDPALGRLRGENNPMEVERPDKWFTDDELAARLYRNVGAYELAAYGYNGFWKEPAGMDPATGQRTFPDLTVLGASVRGPVMYGIGNAEFSWYDSRDDRDGTDPFVQNSEMRLLLGYEQEVATDLTLGFQYYLNYMMDYDNYKKGLTPGAFARDEARHWITVDFTQELMAQNQLVLSLFVFYSLSESDFYFRPRVTYDVTDNWKIQVGGNIFTGKQETFFGQFEENSNVYAAVRYSF